MDFKLNITTDSTSPNVKDKCVEVVANYLDKEGVYFDVNYVADSYYARMNDEYRDLDTRIHKLYAFVNTDERFDKLSLEQKELCLLQLDAMRCYRFALEKRIKLERKEK